MLELSLANYSEGWSSPIKANVCLQAMFFPVLPLVLLQLSSVAASPHIAGWKCSRCTRCKPLTKTKVDGEVETVITVQLASPVMKLFVFPQRLWMRRTSWGRMTEQRWSPPHSLHLLPSPPSHSTPVRVRHTWTNGGRGSWRPDTQQFAVSFHLIS